jgi:hypothetical protein
MFAILVGALDEPFKDLIRLFQKFSNTFFGSQIENIDVDTTYH